MARWLPALPLLALLAGCQSQTPASESPTPSEPPVAAPSNLDRTDLALVNGSERLYVGDTWDVAARVYPAPRSAFEFNELPEKLQANFRARGWETAQEGFGVVLANDRIAAAMLQLDAANQSQLEKILKAYREMLPSLTPTEVAGRQVRFTFYENDSQRLMICAQQMNPRLYITIAVGDKDVMRQLGADPTRAASDRDELDRLFDLRGKPRSTTP